MIPDSLVCRLGEPAGSVKNLGVAADSLNERLDIFELVEEFGVILSEREQGTPLFLFAFSKFLNGPIFESLVAPHTERFISRRVSAATGALDGSKFVGFLGLDLLTLKSRILRLGVLTELGDIASDSLTSPLSSLPIFDQCSVCVPVFRQPSGVRLTEVGRCNGFVNASAVGTLLETLEESLVGVAFGCIEFCPKGSVRVLPVGMFGKPPLEARDTEVSNERDRSLSGLTVDSNPITVLPVRHAADSQIVQLPASETRLELDSNERGVAGVPGSFNHGLHVALQVENLGRVGCRVIVPRGFRGDPRDALGKATIIRLNVDLLSDAPSEHSERDAVIPVRLLVIVLAMNPPNNILRGVAVSERGVQVASVFGDSSTMPEEFEVSVITVLLPEQVEPIAESEQQLAVGLAVTASLTTLDTRPERLYTFSRIGHTTLYLRGIVKLCLNALHRLESSDSKPLPSGTPILGRESSDRDPSLRFKAQGDCRAGQRGAA